jgi:hypothetical protein
MFSIAQSVRPASGVSSARTRVGFDRAELWLGSAAGYSATVGALRRTADLRGMCRAEVGVRQSVRNAVDISG